MKSLSSRRDSTCRRKRAPFTVSAMSWRSVVTPLGPLARTHGRLRALDRRSQCGSCQHPGKVALIILARMDAAVRIDRALCQRGSLSDIALGDGTPDQRLSRLICTQRAIAGAAIGEARPRARA